MKGQLVGKSNCGFSTLELMLAFAILSLMFGGVAMLMFSNNYWSSSAWSHIEAIDLTRVKLADDLLLAQSDFLAAGAGQAINISPCLKLLKPKTTWQINPYPTSTISLIRPTANLDEARSLGGDCLLSNQAQNWINPSLFFSITFTPKPLALDVFEQNTYLAVDESPFLKIITPTGDEVFTNGFTLTKPVNDLDIAKNTNSGKIYAYLAVASSTNQFQIIDVSDIKNPILLASKSLFGVDPTGGAPQGWRLAYYDNYVYLTTRLTAGPEFHIFDVSDPSNPFEISVGKNLSTSVYDLTIRDQAISGNVYRLAYLATTHDNQELQILDVTDPTNIMAVTSLNLPDHPGCSSNQPDTKTLFTLGYDLYLGRENLSLCAGLADLYIIDITNPLATTSVKMEADLGGSVIGLKATNPFVFVATTNLTNPTASKLLDFDENYLYLAKDKAKNVEIWQQDPNNLTKIDTYTAGADPLQLIHSP